MKKSLLIAILGILISSCATTNNYDNHLQYFDENNQEISKAKFQRKRETRKFLAIPGDSVNQKKLTVREKRGKITNRTNLEALLEKEIGRGIAANKPIIIVYYPGKDRCNSSGSATKESRKKWFGELEEGTEQLVNTTPIYIYKDSEGLGKYDGVLTWHKDPQGMVENLFFEHHYPCNSFVVISKNGDYISYFGEFSKAYLWEAAEIMGR
ncbi:hypothetical protein [Haloflavibacter putidus]|uniref:Uncharacterized protein n=1 Tax=Haloflavibacter putidus TaxID=2576776 RepID=A0A507ZVN5_9FLAO|nr:hypothetical protein [Haloflavibacter putidus]TQD37652.1 hypothetical protein FKR84_09270 [Haloflavibacter putidus]